MYHIYYVYVYVSHMDMVVHIWEIYLWKMWPKILATHTSLLQIPQKCDLFFNDNIFLICLFAG